MAETWEHVGERTEPATPLRLAEARERGFVPRSGDLVAAAVLAAAVAAAVALGGGLAGALRRLTAAMLGEAGSVSGGWSDEVTAAAWAVGGWAAGIVAAVTGVAAAANVLQFGLLFSGQAVGADLARLSPVGGLGRMFSCRSAVRGGLALVKVLAAVSIAWIAVQAALSQAASAVAQPAAGVSHWIGGCVVSVAGWVAAAMLAAGLVDLAYQRWQYRQDLKMTRREFLQDWRQMEGGRWRQHAAADRLRGLNGRQEAQGSGRGGA